MKEYILFDLDGTVSDPKVGITRSVRHALNSFGIHIEDTDGLVPFIGPPLRESFQKFYGFSDADAERAVEKYREYFPTTGIYENTLYDGMEPLLEALKSSGKTLVIATSKPAVYAEEILSYFGIGKYFAFVAGSELDGRRSKKGEVIRHAMEQCGISSVGAAVMVGDREHDIFGAKEHGMESVGVTYGYGSRRELLEAGATHIVDSVSELLTLLRRL